MFLPMVILLCTQAVHGQQHYTISLADFCTGKYDEFCPAVLQDDIVFCSNRDAGLFVSYRNTRNKSLFNLFRAEQSEKVKKSSPQIFCRNLQTPFNIGPASFHPDGLQVVFSRNMDTERHIRNSINPGNKLGLYFAELKNGEWIETDTFPYNHSEYNITSPCYSPDGLTLYFGSDMPGGYGGTDLYMCRLVDGKWHEPENLGEKINTPGNELYPFVSQRYQLFFASDGHGGMGMKDLYLTVKSESGWSDPVHLDPPLNSSKDDFGLITDNGFTEGYFSSNRDGSDDIFGFTTAVPQLYNCDTLLANQYCFEFWDDRYPERDTLPVHIKWEFSDGAVLVGERVTHCFPGAGSYLVTFSIIDSSADKSVLTQSTMEVELVDHIQPFITSPDTISVESDVFLSGLESILPGYTIDQYIWDFGDGSFGTGQEVNHRFEAAGSYFIKLGLVVFAENSSSREIKCVVKPLTVISE